MLLSLSVLLAHLYIAGRLGPTYTQIAAEPGFAIDGVTGYFGASMNASSYFILYIAELVQLRPYALALLPVFGLAIFGCLYCYNRYKKHAEGAAPRTMD